MPILKYPFERDRAPEDGPLSEKPRVFQSPLPDPLEAAEPEAVWPFGDTSVRGRLLSSFSSPWLLYQRNGLVRRARHGDEFAALVQQIDAELESRGGE